MSKNITIVFAIALSRILQTPLIVPSAMRVISLGGMVVGQKCCCYRVRGVIETFMILCCFLDFFLAGLRSKLL